MDVKVLEEILTLLKSGVGLSPLSLALLAVSVLLTSGVGAYVAERLKGVATKADVAEITRKVDEVHAEFGQKAAEQEQRYRLQLAALDRRLQVLQEAYVQWWQLYEAVYAPNIRKVAAEADDWYRQHCIYLGREVASAFWEALRAASTHRELLKKANVTAEERMENWDKLVSCGDRIAAAAGLPPIGRPWNEPTGAPA